MWTPQQADALSEVNDWLLRGDEQVFHLFGYAGTGKTSLARHFASGVSGGTFFAAYTGKAAHVLRTKGCEGATTIHSLIYHSRERGQSKLRELQLLLSELIATLRFKDIDPKTDSAVSDLQNQIDVERESLKQPYFILNTDSPVRHAKLIIIDECSMVDARMGQDLLSFGTKVLVLGDPAQLPPVIGYGYFTKDVRPRVMLEEIHRQAEESPIIRIATKVRQGEIPEPGDYGDGVVVLPRGEKVHPDEVVQFDQILVGKNTTRYASNARVRSLLDISDSYPVTGDRLVCLRNNHDEGLLNGAIYLVHGVNGLMDGKIVMDVVPEEGGIPVSVLAHEEHFLGRGKEIPWFNRSEAQEFDYGYALTVHKSQGSQWDSVLLFDESRVFRNDRANWLYTGVTRAAKKLTIAAV